MWSKVGCFFLLSSSGSNCSVKYSALSISLNLLISLWLDFPTQLSARNMNCSPSIACCTVLFRVQQQLKPITVKNRIGNCIGNCIGKRTKKKKEKSVTYSNESLFFHVALWIEDEIYMIWCDVLSGIIAMIQKCKNNLYLLSCSVESSIFS